MSESDEARALRARVERAVGALFEVEEEIGRGGMAVVYRARDRRLRRRVALKVLPPELAYREEVKSRFLREAQMAAQLSHPNIVPIFAVDDRDGLVYFAMGLVEGETLAQRLAAEPRPSVPAVRRILREVAEALAYAHAHGVVHRDVKPDNVLVERGSDRALVSDFGIARAAEGDSRLTVDGIAVGTPAYMSPEQAMGEREIDGRADIYALGIMGYQMLAGTLPFEASNTPAMLMKHISARPRPLQELRPDLPQNLVAAIERAIRKGRDERWPDAAAFRDALAEDAPLPRESRARPPISGAASYDREQLGAEPRGGRPRSASAEGPDPNPAIPAPRPEWRLDPDARDLARDALREWREQRRLWRERYRGPARRDEGLVSEGFALAVTSGLAKRRAHRGLGLSGGLAPEDRIRSVQRRAVSYALTVTFLAAINMVTSPRFPWFIFPALGMGIGLASRVANLWVDGIPLRRLFQRQPHRDDESLRPSAVLAPVETQVPARVVAADLAGIPREVLDGAHGVTIREAAEAKAVIGDVLAKLPDADRQILPEIHPTVDALMERIRSLAQALHQLETDASPEALDRLEQRIAQTRATPEDAPDRARRLELLERQRTTLNDLAARRSAVAQQLESASLVLQTMRLDLLKLRSSGLESRLDATTAATQEARALSDDIGRVLDAAKEVRRL